METASGAYNCIISDNASNIFCRHCDNNSFLLFFISPCAMWKMSPRCFLTTPYPIIREPGSIPTIINSLSLPGIDVRIAWFAFRSLIIRYPISGSCIEKLSSLVFFLYYAHHEFRTTITLCLGPSPSACYYICLLSFSITSSGMSKLAYTFWTSSLSSIFSISLSI